MCLRITMIEHQILGACQLQINFQDSKFLDYIFYQYFPVCF